MKEVVKKYHYDDDYVLLTYCDILESCFTEEEKEMNKDFLQSMRDQVSEE